MKIEIAKKILEFVSTEPKSIQEVAKCIEKSWKTADKYLGELKETNPELQIKVFRKGSHGALKVVYLKSTMKKSGDQLRDRLFNDYLVGKVKDDFDVMEFYMQVNSDKKEMVIEEYQESDISQKQDLIKHLKNCDRTLYVFSGNLSWINVKENGILMLDVLEKMVKRGIKIKVLCRIDAASIRNIHKLKSLDHKHNTDLIEVRHQRHPLRGFIFDDTMLRLKEEIRLGRYKKGEIDNNLRIFYDIHENEWINWLKNIFYYSFNSAMDLASYEEMIKKVVGYV
ncbi:hypothetical protein HN385_00310 [archaeon]|jgi:hypothetical protein|nr:hypothetical protein [archaeon]MBT3451634.1 hypothetical protein [archaeon]MBT6869655.1 hypothetical protein [archaeon]MBT7192423.1 hypothetical protein [archaeon]MBT7380224.1 hypothetical protein [archaeon]